MTTRRRLVRVLSTMTDAADERSTVVIPFPVEVSRRVGTLSARQGGGRELPR